MKPHHNLMKGRPAPANRRRVPATHWLVLAAGSAAACGLLAGCGAVRGSAGAAIQGSGQGQSITLYSGQHEQTTDGLVTAFEKQTGIKVNVRNDDEDTLANLIAVQGSHTQGDVFFTENSPPLEFLQEKGGVRAGRGPDHRRIAPPGRPAGLGGRLGDPACPRSGVRLVGRLGLRFPPCGLVCHGVPLLTGLPLLSGG
jgi:iron(III) transport system substrate-binding protein